jgi:hypothetical protein
MPYKTVLISVIFYGSRIFKKNLLLSGEERAEQERQRAEQESQRAEKERQRSERLIAQLRALGVEPEA